MLKKSAAPQIKPAKPAGPFNHLNAWQLLLTVIPLVLLFVGGAVGGLIGAGAAAGNSALVKKQKLSTPVLALAMIGIDLAAWIAFVLVIRLIGALFR